MSAKPEERGCEILSERIAAEVAAYEALSPVDRALADSDQFRRYVEAETGRDPGDVLADEVRRLRGPRSAVASITGPFSTGEPEDDDGDVTVRDAAGNDLTADEIVTWLNYFYGKAHALEMDVQAIARNRDEYRERAYAAENRGTQSATEARTGKRPITRSSCACEVGDDDVFIEKCALHSDWLKALLDIALCRMREDGRRGAVSMDVFGPWARQRAAEVIPEDEYKAAVEALNAAAGHTTTKERP